MPTSLRSYVGQFRCKGGGGGGGRQSSRDPMNRVRPQLSSRTQNYFLLPALHFFFVPLLINIPEINAAQRRFGGRRELTSKKRGERKKLTTFAISLCRHEFNYAP